MSEEIEDEAAIEARNKREQRMMWILSGAIVLLILGGMGANMLWGPGAFPSSPATDISSQSRSSPEH